jgi:hypothetical protein
LYLFWMKKRRFSFRDFLFAILPILDEKTAIFFSRFSFRDFTYSG